MNETLARLRLIIDAKKAKRDDKDFIEKLADEKGIPLKNRACSSCWIDKATELYILIQSDTETDTEEGRYVLRKGVDVWFGSIRVNAATLTDELAEQILSAGFERSFFPSYQMKIEANAPLKNVADILPYISESCRMNIEAAAVEKFGAFNVLTIEDLSAISQGNLDGILGNEWSTDPTVLQWAWAEYAKKQMEIFVKTLERFTIPETPEEKRAAEGLPSVTFIEGLLVFSQSFFSLPSYVAAAKTTIGDIVIAKKAEYRRLCMQRRLDRIQAQKIKSKK